MHPSMEIRNEISHRLDGRIIVLGVTGSVAAVECFALVRDLVRHGAKVIPVMSAAAQDIVTPYSLEFASGVPPITALSGQAEHVSLLGDGKDHADLLLVYPCTANTISKMALGIDDGPVTTMATVALGSDIPVLIAPAMHDCMFRNRAVASNLQRLEDMGVKVLGPHVVDVRAKVASRPEVVAEVLRALGKSDLEGKKVLIIGGRSEEPIDEMRIITNRSTGAMTANLLEVCFERGANLECWLGATDVPIPSYIECKRFRHTRELEDLAEGRDFDLVIVPAALADFAPQPREGKISSDAGDLTLHLSTVPKFLPRIAGHCRLLVAFKAESGMSDEDLVARARQRMSVEGPHLTVANDISMVGQGEGRIILVTEQEAKEVSGDKRALAESIIDACVDMLP
ncbi:MAG: bifunctional phosphopantothenoylcysteine decarboxylase/phosphopantothenate--cysteine ligase CoaBC [Candidatus Methanomethylophilaceae archaeon]